MNRSQAIMGVLVVGLGGFYYWHDVEGKPKREAAETKAKRLFPELKREDLSSLTVERLKPVGTDKPFKRQIGHKHGLWILESEPTPEVLNNLSMSNAVKGLTEIQRGDALTETESPNAKLNPAEFGLDKPSYKIEMKTKDGKAHTLLIGDKTPEGRGLYVQADGGSIESSPSSMTELLETAPDKMRETSPVTFEPARMNKVTITMPDGKTLAAELAKPREKNKEGDDDPSIVITDLNEEWNVTSPKASKADSQKIRNFLNVWKGAKHGRFLRSDEKVNFSNPYLKVEAFVDGEKEPYIFELGQNVPAKPTMRYLRRLNPEEVMVIEMDNPKLLEIAEDSFEQKHLAVFEPDDIKKVELQLKDQTVSGSRKDQTWTISKPAKPGGDEKAVESALGDLLFDLKSLEWKSKVSGTLSQVGKFELLDKDGKKILSLLLGQESGKGRLAQIEESKELLLLDPDPFNKYESILKRITTAATSTPTPGASSTPSAAVTPVAVPETLSIPEQKASPMVPLHSNPTPSPSAKP
jgi:hypothetical protein